MTRHFIFLIFLSFLLPFYGNSQTQTTIYIDKVMVTVPETITERFFVQFFVMQPGNNNNCRTIKEASEVYERAKEGEKIEIKPTLRS